MAHGAGQTLWIKLSFTNRIPQSAKGGIERVNGIGFEKYSCYQQGG
jgi:hypothetical protein